ncbi:hypothetical protein BKA66DRAFT_443745 [Pyrenochaeta sp. MPI-SDFR-AT-0127]|nr:hypothetical protein BKA66DRAFT_443745 [Pyrenochaeta sp. MPI-SDFR-AT-0127]
MHTNPKPPVLQLRPTTEDERIEEKTPDLLKCPDGPWIIHPDQIEENVCTLADAQFPLDIDIENYRVERKEQRAAFLKEVRQLPISQRIENIKVSWFYKVPPLVDMKSMLGMSHDEIEYAVELNFVHHDFYLQPGQACVTSLYEKFGRDWSWNARGVYYRQFHSPLWVTADHSLWIPTVDYSMFDDPMEEHRRTRAKKFLRHALDNERWNKSEYAWEADAWTDVFGQMRNDPALAADKRDYYAKVPEVYPLSCTLTGKSRCVKRIPDASFGLATFHPKHYQNAVASYELDAERLQALAWHRQCGLISDPRCGEADLVFPFAVYEAKGWNGDPREARQQACAAGAAYLDMLDALARLPGPPEETDRDYQFSESRNAQVFAITSFGAQWHIMVGYRRPRLKREHAGHPGMSKTVYLFQRIWSGRIADERSAWQLLYLVDQIHMWGATTFRRYVIQHLEAWHMYCHQRWVKDTIILRYTLGKDFASCGKMMCFDVPDWAKGFGDEFRTALQEKSAKLLVKRCIQEQTGEPCAICVLGRCGTEHSPGYALFSPEEHLRHLTKVHHLTADENLISAINESHGDAVVLATEIFDSSHCQEERKRLLEDCTDERKGKREKRSDLKAKADNDG